MKNIIIKNSDRFKSVFVSVNLLLPLKEEETGKNALLAMILKKSNKLCATEKELNIKLANLYNTSLDINVEKTDNLYNIQCSMELLNIEYMTKEAVEQAKELLYAVVCMPNISEGTFDKQIFDREKASLIEKIKEERDEKRKYAIKCLEQDMFEGTDYGCYVLGTQAQISQITNEQLVKHYEYVMNNAEVVITAVGNFDNMEDFPSTLYNQIIKKCGKHTVENIKTIEDLTQKIKQREEKQEIAQSVLCIGLKLEEKDREDMYKMVVYNALLGGTPASKLFQNVREKESLAYTVRSMYNRHKKAIYMYAGIDPNNDEAAKRLMLEQVELLKQGKISELEFNAAKHSVVSGYKEIQDSKSSIAKNMLNNEIYFNSQIDIEEMITSLAMITPEEVVEIAQRIKATNIFLLGGVANV